MPAAPAPPRAADRLAVHYVMLTFDPLIRRAPPVKNDRPDAFISETSIGSNVRSSSTRAAAAAVSATNVPVTASPEPLRALYENVGIAFRLKIPTHRRELLIVFADSIYILRIVGMHSTHSPRQKGTNPPGRLPAAFPPHTTPRPDLPCARNDPAPASIQSLPVLCQSDTLPVLRPPYTPAAKISKFPLRLRFRVSRVDYQAPRRLMERSPLDHCRVAAWSREEYTLTNEPTEKALPGRECDFPALGIKPDLIAALDRLHLDAPTDIQCQMIPVVLAGKDCLARAHSGTGKPIPIYCLSCKRLRPARVSRPW